MLTACGGGGSVSRDDTDNGAGNGNGGTTTPTYTVSLALENANGEGDNNLSENNSLTVIATVTDQDGNALSDSLVTFALDNAALATFANDTGTARTNDSGVARIGLNASTASGDGQITASLNTGETGTTTFSAEGIEVIDPNVITVDLDLLNNEGEEDSELTPTNSLQARASVLNALGEPQEDLLVTFALSNDELATFSNETGTARTNSEGVAVITLTAGSIVGDGNLIASIESGERSTTSFSVLVASQTSIDLVLTNLDGTEGSSLTPSNDLLATVTVINTSGVIQADRLVTFSLSNSDLAAFSNDTGTARTDSNGVASIQLSASSGSGDGELTATLDSGESDITTFSAQGVSTGVPPTVSLTINLTDQNGEADSDLAEGNPLVAVVRVVNSEGVNQSDRLVTFSLSNPELATFSNDTATARTNSEGVATIGLSVGEASGDGVITASLETGEEGTTTFSSSGSDASVSISLINQNGDPDPNLAADNPLIATVIVLNSEGDALADRLLTFSLNNPQLAAFSNGTATARTNSNGFASIGLSVGDVSGDGVITVALDTGEEDTTTFSSSGRSDATEEPASLELFADSIQLASSGSDEVELIALVKNEQSVLMEGVEVSFSAPSADGVELQLIQTTTAADGTARALLSTRNNAANRIVTVSAQAGSLSPENVSIEIDGTEVTVNGASSVILNDTVNYTIRVQDSDGTSILNQSVQLEASGGTLGTSEVNTGSTGQATVSYTASESGENTITATALNASAMFTVQVQQDEFNFIDLPTEEIPIGQTQTITIQWRQNNTPVVGEDVTFSASRGVIAGNSTVETDTNGQASIEISADNAGISSITASASDGSGVVLVSALTQIEFIATEPDTLIADASPDILGPDGQTSTISAVVRDINGNLVKNSVVNFSVSDVSTGFVSPSQATTDSKGIATTVFTSGSVSSEDDVVVTASVADDSAIFDDVFLTVGSRAFDIVIGTGNVIETPNTTSYLKRFAVFVSDSVGRPVGGVNLTASVTPVKRNDISGRGVYIRGEWQYDAVDSIWKTVNTTACNNEDQNFNGILDLGEDLNGDDQLTPGIVGTVTLSNNGVTDENGYAELEYRYPESYAVWYFAEVSVFGQSTGSEAQASMKYRLEILADDITDEGTSPPENPFGVGICPEDE
jgi:hypothetical protein